GRGSRLPFAHRLETISDVVQPEHGRADAGPARARREFIEHLPHRCRELTETGQRQLVVALSERAPERCRVGADPDRWLARGSTIVAAKLGLQKRAVLGIADESSPE